MKHWKQIFILAAYILASPLLLLWGGWRFVRYLRVLRRAIAPYCQCSNCHHRIPLVGLWQCQCGYAYRGHLMMPCKICGRVPGIARCQHCHITTPLL